MAASKPELDASNISRPNDNVLTDSGEGMTELSLIISTATEKSKRPKLCVWAEPHGKRGFFSCKNWTPKIGEKKPNQNPKKTGEDNLSAGKERAEGQASLHTGFAGLESQGGFLNKVTGRFWGTGLPSFFTSKSKIQSNIPGSFQRLFISHWTSTKLVRVLPTVEDKCK